MSELIDRRLKVLADALDGCPLTEPYGGDQNG